MATFGATYVCLCKTEVHCEWEDLNIGKVMQCLACKEVRACVLTQDGVRAWVKVDPSDVEFFSLIRDPTKECEE